MADHLKLGKTGIIVAARTNSSRLPGKALLPLNGMPMIRFLLERLSPLEDASVVFATTTLGSDDQLAAIVQDAGVPVFRGNADDLVDRYAAAADHFGFDTVGRITGDCPFVDAAMLKFCMEQAANLTPFDLATTKGAFPVGLDVEFYPSRVMTRLHRQTELTARHREHLTLYMYDHKEKFTVHQLTAPSEWHRSRRSFTVDTPSDYEAAQALAAPFIGARFPIADMLERAAA